MQDSPTQGGAVAQTASSTILDPAHPESWAAVPFDQLFSLGREEVEAAQQAAFEVRFDALRPKLEALDKLATRQGFDQVGSVYDAIPVFFDHRVLKSYPLSLIEKGQYDRLTKWFQRLTTHDLSDISLDGVDSLDTWMDRLEEHGMIIGHSTGTTGKLSFVPRSQVEWPAWSTANFEMLRCLTGVDFRQEKIPYFTTGYRTGHQMMMKMVYLFACAQAGGDENRHCLYEHGISADLLSLMGRFRTAEARGEADKLKIDPRLLDQRAALIEANANREQDMEIWFKKLAEEYRGQRVRIGGGFADLTRLAIKAKQDGFRCEFSPDSILISGGGMKGYKDAPPDWKQRILDFLGMERMYTHYGMSENMGQAPQCTEGFFHFFPYTLPIILDEDFVPLPREGVQTGRMALFDFLAETYWGGFISGDRVTIRWDGDCACGWPNPRIESEIVRFSDLAGVEDDKLTCAGTVKAYSDFMDYVGTI
jgi:hypothetical protein